MISKVIVVLSIIFLFGCVENKTPLIFKKESDKNIIRTCNVTESTLLPFEHISFCNNLNINSKFNFDEFGNVKIYEKENDTKYCNSTQSYWIDSIELNFFEYDFSFGYELKKLTRDSLIIYNKYQINTQIDTGIIIKLVKVEPNSIKN